MVYSRLILVFIISINLMLTHNAYSQQIAQQDFHKIKVNEIIQTTNYTYLRVSEDSLNYWMALPKREVILNEIYFYSKAVEMKNFKSRELNRTFDSIYFISGIKGTEDTNLSSHHVSKPIEEIKSQDIIIEKKEGVKSIAEIFANREENGGTRIVIRGKVVKVNNKILGRNWIHLQDGTKFENEFDITITTKEMIKEGDIITISGTVSLNRNFGQGYVYKTIIEDAILINE